MAQQEKYANKQYNDQALLAASQGDQLEEGTEANRTGMNLETHIQVNDSYREGTINPDIEEGE